MRAIWCNKSEMEHVAVGFFCLRLFVVIAVLT